MKKYTLLILLFSIYSCSQDINDERVNIIDSIYIELEDGESVTEMSKKNTDLYFNYIGNPDLQAPLFKHIKGTNYDLFVGVPVGTNFSKMKKSFKKDGIFAGKSENSSTPFVYVNFNSEGKNITKYLEEIDKNLVFLVLVSATDTAIPQAQQTSVSRRLSKQTN